MQREYCSIDDILLGEPKLTAPVVEIPLTEIVSRATALVRGDLDGTVDIDAIESVPALPGAVRTLATLKGKELAYLAYYGAERPEQSEVERYSADYDRRVRWTLEKVRKGELDSTLTRPVGERRFFRFI